MDTLTAIFSRRSIRRYRDEPVPMECIDTIIRAGMAAPSGKRQYVWHFVIVQDKNTLQYLADLHKYGKMLQKTPVAVLLCADLKNAPAPLFFEQDLSAVTENMLLAAHHLGLGSVWLSIHPREERKEAVRTLLNIPRDIIPFTLLPFGYPDEFPAAPVMFKPERIHLEKW